MLNLTRKFLLIIPSIFLIIGCQDNRINPVEPDSLVKESFTGATLAGRLKLVPYDEKEPEAWGKVDHNLFGATLQFHLVAHRLTPNTYYALYSANGDDARDNVERLLGFGSTNNGGNINFLGEVTGGGLQNCKFTLWYCNEDGSKKWEAYSDGLVLHSIRSSGYVFISEAAYWATKD